MRVEEIKKAIESLPREDFAEIRKWVAERDWEMWDLQIAEDSKKGALDFLLREAFEEKRGGRLRDL